jgi:hypothetical protein
MGQKMAEIIAESELTCPECGHKSMETMPADNCQFFYECKGCGTLLKPLQGDCCVYCSYGTVPYPPIQEAQMSVKDGGCCG